MARKGERTMDNLRTLVSQDITFCVNRNCPIKEYCHRAIGCTKRIASYSDFSPICNITNVYEHFIQADMSTVEQKRRMKKNVNRVSW